MTMKWLAKAAVLIAMTVTPLILSQVPAQADSVSTVGGATETVSVASDMSTHLVTVGVSALPMSDHPDGQWLYIQVWEQDTTTGAGWAGFGWQNEGLVTGVHTAMACDVWSCEGEVVQAQDLPGFQFSGEPGHTYSVGVQFAWWDESNGWEMGWLPVTSYLTVYYQQGIEFSMTTGLAHT